MNASEPKELAVQNRTGFLGGSDLAAVLGISPWKTPYELYEEKLGIAPETEDDERRDRILKRGKRLEPVVMEMLGEEYDIAVTERNRIAYDPEFSWMRAEIDFEYMLPGGSIGNGDVKTVHPYAAKDWGETLTDEVPVYYIAQFQWGMMITGAQVCAVAALIGADDLRLYYVPRDAEIIAMLRAKALQFWDEHVMVEIPPPMKTAADAERMLKRFNGVSVMADADVQKIVDRLKRIKEAEKRLEAKREEYETTIKLTLAGAVKDTSSGKFQLVDASGKSLATWNQQENNRLNTKRVELLYPWLRETYTATSTFRVLRIK